MDEQTKPTLERLFDHTAGEDCQCEKCAAIRAVLAENERLRVQIEQRTTEAESALRSLTPGGSEFQTVEECARYIRETREERWEAFKREVQQRRQAEAALAAAQQADRANIVMLQGNVEEINALKERLAAERQAREAAEQALAEIEKVLSRRSASGWRVNPHGMIDETLRIIRATRARAEGQPAYVIVVEFGAPSAHVVKK
jgi:DNA repair exonuclease SbcCD ATPase subunit